VGLSQDLASNFADFVAQREAEIRRRQTKRYRQPDPRQLELDMASSVKKLDAIQDRALLVTRGMHVVERKA